MVAVARQLRDHVEHEGLDHAVKQLVNVSACLGVRHAPDYTTNEKE
jgi:hypothetical protein